jgi:DNA-binding MarR family transcriptional regulator
MTKTPGRRPTRPARIDPEGEFPLEPATYVFHLFAVISRHREARIDEMLKPLALNLSKHRALAVVQRLEPCTMKQLADFSAVDRTTLTRTVDQLVAAGLVERQTPPTDRRQVLLSLTDEGRSTTGKSLDVIRKLNRQLVTDMADPEQRAVARAFQRFVTNLVDEPALRRRLMLQEEDPDN